MKVIVTGAAGFLGWHTRARLHALTDHEVIPVTREVWPRLGDLVSDADAVIHIAGVNRGDAEDVESGNIRLAEDLSAAVQSSGRPLRLVYANSIQAGNSTPYGTGKARAAVVLRTAAEAVGGTFTDVLLPNLFGEHGRPGYNSFVATFVDAVSRGDEPEVQDREVSLLHAQAAAQSLMDALAPSSPTRVAPPSTPTTVTGVLSVLKEFQSLYAGGDIPILDTQLRVDLFNTYRAAIFPTHYPIRLTTHADERGRLVETVRAHGGQGQTFVSTTRPGVTRGEHFHITKVERFVVLSGEARISLRRLFSDHVVSFDVSGESPAIVDMPTMWVHNITNIGRGELTTLFWTNVLFDPQLPDTYAESVRHGAGVMA